MTDRKKWIILVAKLLEATQNNNIKWILSLPPDTIFQSGERTDQIYETQFMGKRFRLYPYTFKIWIDDERFEWTEGVKLEFVDDMRRSIFEVPSVEGIGDLLEAARYQTAEISQFLENL